MRPRQAHADFEEAKMLSNTLPLPPPQLAPLIAGIFPMTELQAQWGAGDQELLRFSMGTLMWSWVLGQDMLWIVCTEVM